MATEAQIVANRRNAQASTGPRSAEGQRRVSRNAITHGLDCREVVMRGEDPAAFDHYRQAMLADNLPVGAQEQDCVERMVAAQWRIRRAWRAEPQIHAQACERMGCQADVGTVILYDLNNEKGLTQVERKETTFSREYLRWSRRLQELQDQRRKGLRHGIEEEAENGGSKLEEQEAGNPAEHGEGSGPVGRASPRDSRVEIVGRASPPDSRAEMTTTAQATATPSSDGASGETAEQSQSAAVPGSGFRAPGDPAEVRAAQAGEHWDASGSTGVAFGKSAEQSQFLAGEAVTGPTAPGSGGA
jgi:hypothetical protein